MTSTVTEFATESSDPGYAWLKARDRLIPASAAAELLTVGAQDRLARYRDSDEFRNHELRVTQLKPGRSVRPSEAVRWHVTCGPNVLAIKGVDVKLECFNAERLADVAAANEAANRNQLEHVTYEESLHVGDEITRSLVPKPGRRGSVTSWSAGSRRRMMRRIAGAEHVPKLGMITLTLPGAWHLTARENVWRTPARFKAELTIFRKRWAREVGYDMQAFWKAETQRRGAPHAHLGAGLREALWHFTPSGVDGWERMGDGQRRVARQRLADAGRKALADWVGSNWHDIVMHDGKRCRTPDDQACADHLRHGTDVDLTYADRVDDGRSVMAAYFAKHGVWASKEYQHDTPGSVIVRDLQTVQAFAPLGELVITGQKPRTQFVGSKLVTTMVDVWGRRPDVDRWFRFAAEWSGPGRWWGVWRIKLDTTMELDDVDQDTVDGARLLFRKIVKRRTQRLVAVERPGGCLTAVIVSRRLHSLYGDADRGWWLIAKDGAGLMEWALCWAWDHLRGVPRCQWARILALADLPDTEPERQRTRDHCEPRVLCNA